MDFIKNRLSLRNVGIGGDKDNDYDYTAKVGGLAINTTIKLKKIPPQRVGIFRDQACRPGAVLGQPVDEFTVWTDGVLAVSARQAYPP
jgi:hypothetical protein